MTRIKRDFKWFYVCIPCADTKSTTGSRRAPHELCVKPHSPHGRYHQKVETLIFFRKIRFFAKKMFAKKQVPINFIDKIFENMRNLKVVDENPFEKS